MDVHKLVKWFKEIEDDIKCFEQDIKEKDELLQSLYLKRQFLLDVVVSMNNES